MFKVTNNWDDSSGTSRVGAFHARYKDLVLAFGEPMASDGYKVSGEWIFKEEESGEVFTIYDWKSTSLYDDSLWSVEEFRASDEITTFNVGGFPNKGSAERFINLVKRQIEYVKIDEPFREIVLLDKPKEKV